MERIISAGLLSVELDSNKRGLRKSLSKNRCKGLMAPGRLIPVVKRAPPVTNDNKKMSLFENFGTVKQFYTIISHSQTRLNWSFKHTWFPFLSSCVCVPAFIKPNISLPLNHIKPLLLIKFYRYLSFIISILSLLVFKSTLAIDFSFSDKYVCFSRRR